MATDEGGGGDDDDGDAGEDGTGEDGAGEDAPPGEDTDIEQSYGSDISAPILTAPAQQVAIDVSTIPGNKHLGGLSILSSVGISLIDGTIEGNISSDGFSASSIVYGSPGAKFYLDIVDIDDDKIFNLSNVEIPASGRYQFIISFPKSSTTNKYKINLRAGDGTRMNTSLPSTDPMWTINQRANPTVTFTRSGGTASGVTYSGSNVTFTAAPYTLMNAQTSGNQSTRLNSSTTSAGVQTRKSIKLFGEFDYTVTAAKGGAKVYIKNLNFNFTNNTVIAKRVTQKVNNSNIVYLDDVTSLYVGMEFMYDDVILTKKASISNTRMRVSNTKDLVVGMWLFNDDGSGITIASIDSDNIITLSSSITIPDRELLIFRRFNNVLTIKSIDTNLNAITLQDTVDLEIGKILSFKNNEMRFGNTKTVSGSGSASITLTNTIKMRSFGSRDVTFTLPEDDVFTLTPNAYNQSVNVIKETATNIDVMLTDNDDNVSGKTPSTVRNPAHGKITGSYGAGDGVITYTPNVGFVGQDSFDFKVNDGTTDSEVKTIYITVHK